MRMIPPVFHTLCAQYWCYRSAPLLGVHRVLGVPVSYRCDHGQFVCYGVDVFAPANLCVTALFLLATG
jgi:hypothetical protein